MKNKATTARKGHVDTFQDKDDVLMSQVLNNDSLRQLARRQRADAERAILTAAKTISPAIASE